MNKNRLELIKNKQKWWGRPELNRRPLPKTTQSLSLRVSLRQLQRFVIPFGQQTQDLLSGARRLSLAGLRPHLIFT